MPNEMIERCARALYAADEGLSEDEFDRESYPDRQYYAHLARAVLQALRYEDGVDEEVAIAAGAVIGVDAVLAIECHNAWINQALSED